MVFASLSGLDEFGKLRIPKSIKKPFRKVGAATAGAFTLGLVKPKAFGIRSRSGMQAFRVGRAVGIGTVAVAAATFLPAAVGPALSAAGKVIPSFGGVKRPKAPSEDRPIPGAESPFGVPEQAAAAVAPVQAAVAGLGPVAIVGGALLLGFMLLGGKR